MYSQYLSEKERQKGRREMILFEAFNGVSFGMLGDTLVYILAVRFFAPNIILGFIPTAIYATPLIIPLISRILEGKNLGRTLYVSWVLRGLVSLMYIGMLFTSGNLRIAVLISTYILYTLFRAIGIISYDPITKSLTTIHSRGGFYSTLNFTYNVTITFAKILASLTTYFYDSLLAIIILQMVGVIGNAISADHARKIPCRITYSKFSDMKLLPIFRIIFFDAKIRNRVFLKWINFIVTIVMGMTIPFMSVKVGLSDGLVIIYSVIISLAYIAAGFVSKFLSDKTGAKPILMISSVATVFFIFLFIWAPASSSFWFFFAIGFFLNFFLQTSVIQSNQLVVASLPNNNIAGFSIAVNLGAAVVAISSGFISGWLVTVGENIHYTSRFTLLSDYSLCFMFGLVSSIFGLAYAITLREKNAKKATELISLKNLQAISQLSAMEKSIDSFYRRKHIMYLGEASSSFVYGEIKKKLSSPYSREIHDLLQVIGEKKLEYYIPDCIIIAKNDDNYMQMTAIETLSNFNTNETVSKCLEDIFYNSRWVSARAACAKALSNFENKSYLFNDVEKLSRNAVHIEVCVDCIIAGYYMDDKKRVFLDLFSDWSLDKNIYFKQTRYSCFDALLMNKNAMSRLARLYEDINLINKEYEMDKNNKKFYSQRKNVFNAFLEDYRNIDIIDKNYLKFLDSLVESHFETLTDYTEKLLTDENGNHSPSINMCIEGIRKFKQADRTLLSETDYLAYVYFSIFVKNSIEENNIK